MHNEQLIPRINVNDDTVEISHWYVEGKSLVKRGQDIVDLGTSKATVTLQAEHEGYLKPLFVKGSLAKVGQPVARFFTSIDELEKHQGTPATSPGKSAPAPAVSTGNEGFARFSARAQELLEKKGLDPKRFEGMGLVTANIIESTLTAERPEVHQPAIQKPVTLTHETPPDMSLIDHVENVGLAKAAEIDSLISGQSGNINSSLTVQFEAEKIYSGLKDHKVFSRSLLPIIIFELSRLLEKYPRFNAFFNNGQIYYYKKVNVGVAIDSGKGLCVVSLRDTNKIFPVEIFKLLSDYTLKYLQNKLKLEELTGSTFTLTDLSSYGVLSFQPLINKNQAAILGIGGDKDAAHFPMTLTLTFDHRVLTGLQVSEFLSSLKKRILSYATP
jgi:pyruvate/2-oxoglutarate dehydrogenase complex dihydrolipoamide acyltransferase (E2) component